MDLCVWIPPSRRRRHHRLVDSGWLVGNRAQPASFAISIFFFAILLRLTLFDRRWMTDDDALCGACLGAWT